MPVPSCEFYNIIASASALSTATVSASIGQLYTLQTKPAWHARRPIDGRIVWRTLLVTWTYLLPAGMCCDVEILRIISAFGHLREYSVLLAWKKFYIGMCNDWENQNVKPKIPTANLPIFMSTNHQWPTKVTSTGQVLWTDILCCTLTTRAVFD